MEEKNWKDKILDFIPEPKRKLGILQAIIISNQAFNKIPTFCRICKDRISFKVIKGDGSFTRKCKCGCRLFLSHEPDNFHKTRYFTEKYIGNPKYLTTFLFDPNYKKKNCLEQAGLIKTKQNNKTVYAKEL